MLEANQIQKTWYSTISITYFARYVGIKLHSQLAKECNWIAVYVRIWWTVIKLAR